MNKKKHKFHEKIFFRENPQLWPAAQKTQQQKFHTTTFWLLKNLPKKQIIIFGLKSVWVNFNLYYTSYLFSHFFWFYFLWLLKNEVLEKNPCKLLEKQISEWGKDFFVLFFKRSVWIIVFEWMRWACNRNERGHNCW